MTEKYEDCSTVPRTFVQDCRVVMDFISLTDVILTNKPCSVLTSGVFDLGLSDHNLIYTIMRLQRPKISSRRVVKPHLNGY